MSAERNDYLPLDLGPVSSTDVALLRPPTGLWGYNAQATDEALDLIAESIRERDVRIVALEQLVTDLSRRDHAPMPAGGDPYAAARHRREAMVGTAAAQAPYDSSAAEPGPPAAEDSAAAPAPADLSPAGSGWASVAQETAWSPVAAPAAEPARLSFEPPTLTGDDLASTPPEESHD